MLLLHEALHLTVFLHKVLRIVCLLEMQRRIRMAKETDTEIFEVVLLMQEVDLCSGRKSWSNSEYLSFQEGDVLY